MRSKRLRDRQPLRRRERIGARGRESRSCFVPAASAAAASSAAQSAISAVILFVRPVPFQHGEFGMMQRTALAVAEHAREGEQPLLAGCEQLLGGELRRGMEIELRTARVRRDQFGRERVQVRLVAGRSLQDRGLDLDEIAGDKPRPQGRRDAHARQQKRPPVGINVRRPPGRRGHPAGSPESTAQNDWRMRRNISMLRPDISGRFGPNH